MIDNLASEENYSINLTLIEVIDKIFKTLDDRGCTLRVFLDLSKAFETIYNNVLFRNFKITVSVD